MQADKPSNNKLMMIKMSSLHKTKHDGRDDSDEDKCPAPPRPADA
jgi:hypothetical protein